MKNLILHAIAGVFGVLLGGVILGYLLDSLFTGTLKSGDAASWLGATSSSLSTAVTIIAVFIAYKSYRNWIYQITHPEQFSIDRTLVEELNVIHAKCLRFARDDGFLLSTLIWQFREINVDDEPSALQPLEEQWEGIRLRQHQTLNSNLLVCFDKEVYSKAIPLFGDVDEVPEPILKYKAALEEYIYSVSLVCSNRQSPCLFQFNSWPYIKDNSEITLDDLAENGACHHKLHDALGSVRKHYKNKWNVT